MFQTVLKRGGKVVPKRMLHQFYVYDLSDINEVEAMKRAHFNDGSRQIWVIQ